MTLATACEEKHAFLPDDRPRQSEEAATSVAALLNEKKEVAFRAL
jgi:hypothetical protein